MFKENLKNETFSSFEFERSLTCLTDILFFFSSVVLSNLFLLHTYLMRVIFILDLVRPTQTWTFET